MILLEYELIDSIDNKQTCKKNTWKFNHTIKPMAASIRKVQT